MILFMILNLILLNVFDLLLYLRICICWCWKGAVSGVGGLCANVGSAVRAFEAAARVFGYAKTFVLVMGTMNQ